MLIDNWVGETARSGAGLLIGYGAVGVNGEFHDRIAVVIEHVEILTVGRRHFSDGVCTARGEGRAGELDQCPSLTVDLIRIDLAGILLGGRDVNKIDRIGRSARNNTESQTKGHYRGQGDPA